MSFADILNKLAEKKALQGDSDFAYRLISASEKEEEKEEKEAEMIKRGKDRKKLASKELWIAAYEELVEELIPKFMERGLGENEAEMAAEQYLEKNYRLVDDRAADKEGDAIDWAMDHMRDNAYASSLSDMIKKYAGKDRKKLAFSDESWLDSWLKAREDLFMMLIPKFIERGMEKYEAEMAAEQYLEKHPHLVDEKAAILDEGRLDQGIMMAGEIYASSLSKMIKKYAGEDWDLKSEEVYERMMPEKSIPLDGPDEFYEECRFVDTPVGRMLIIEVDSTRFEPGTKFRCSEII
jgi:predicted CopG family antitoxin